MIIMQKNTDKIARHEALTNNFLVQLSFGIGCAIYTFFLMKSSVMVDYVLAVRQIEKVCFTGFGAVAVALLIAWLYTRKSGHRAGFIYSLLFSLANLYIIVYPRVTRGIFGGYFYNIMYGEFKTLFILIGVGILACFVAYVAMDNMPVKKGNKNSKKSRA